VRTLLGGCFGLLLLVAACTAGSGAGAPTAGVAPSRTPPPEGAAQSGPLVGPSGPAPLPGAANAVASASNSAEATPSSAPAGPSYGVSTRVEAFTPIVDARPTPTPPLPPMPIPRIPTPTPIPVPTIVIPPIGVPTRSGG